MPAPEALRALAAALVAVVIEVHADRLKVGPKVMPNGRSGHRRPDGRPDQRQQDQHQQDQEQRNEKRGAA